MENLKKPELLIPVGNTEAFHAAVEGGANAIYLGLKNFNARNRASNFGYNQLNALIKVATENNIRVYITLNTVIKNSEIPELLEVIWSVLKLKATALIIQDWGVYYLLRKHFPNLPIHASTQMANHNSLGAEYSDLMGFERVILARELTFNEIKSIQEKTNIELEVFTHGALCYSFSGMCLFSSFLGGYGANRGHCTQPCRRNFKIDKKEDFIFSLKDFQLIDHIEELSKLGISSLKVEGRMKSAEYVYRVAKAYRMVIDNPNTIEAAKELLDLDFGREKTEYFMGKDVGNAITKQTNTGIYLGKIQKIDPEGFEFESRIELTKGSRLRIRTNNDKDQTAFKINEFKKLSDENYYVYTDTETLSKNNEIYLASLRDKKFSNKLNLSSNNFNPKTPRILKEKVFEDLKNNQADKSNEIYVRIDSISWMKKVNLEEIDGLFVNLSKTEWDEFIFDSPFLIKNKHKIHFEFPKFIAEKNIEYYQKFVDKATKFGYSNFVISHLSQILLIPEEANIITNENVYCYNDFSILLLKHQDIKNFIYPLENDFENMKNYKDKTGLVTIYFHPDLFYSRMPVTISNTDSSFKDDKNIVYNKEVKDGITIINPEVPVSFTHYVSKLKEMGYTNYVIDFSHSKVSKNLFYSILKKMKNSEQIQPAFNFNMKNGLK